MTEARTSSLGGDLSHCAFSRPFKCSSSHFVASSEPAKPLNEQPEQQSQRSQSSQRRFEDGLWTCPHRIYTLEELSGAVDKDYECIDLQCCTEPPCRQLLSHELHWISPCSKTPSSQRNRASSNPCNLPTREPTTYFRAHISTTVQILSTIHQTTAATPRRMSTMRRDFTAQRLQFVLQDAAMPICGHSSLSDVPVVNSWTVDFLPLRKGNTVYRTARRKCFSRYWECVQCRYAGTETAVGFEARAVDRPKWFGRDRKVIVLTVVIKRDVGLLCPEGSCTSSSSETPISRSSSWETHAVTGEKLRRFKDSWGRWVGRVRLANEECGLRWLLEGLSRLATVKGGMMHCQD